MLHNSKHYFTSNYFILWHLFLLCLLTEIPAVRWLDNLILKIFTFLPNFCIGVVLLGMGVRLKHTWYKLFSPVQQKFSSSAMFTPFLKIQMLNSSLGIYEYTKSRKQQNSTIFQLCHNFSAVNWGGYLAEREQCCDGTDLSAWAWPHLV